jgi:hypothetical protein
MKELVDFIAVTSSFCNYESIAEFFPHIMKDGK